ncbi:hypothetical protein [Steroidobacter cummioxidans]|uniref:hypothetical protein n=1 Tax=Steroidobacter cummioxidans TaxID=1803913 RepID=UPI000E32103E|nr:hypothetical protein [Steroidobacter cummioxidans]
MDDKIQGGELNENEPHALAISEDGAFLEIAAFRMPLESLAQLLCQLRELALVIASFAERDASDAEA